MSLSFRKKQYPSAIILMAIRWYVAYKLSYRDIEELLNERGVKFDHATIRRWVIEYALQLTLSRPIENSKITIKYSVLRYKNVHIS